jgi:hypothetical protein
MLILVLCLIPARWLGLRDVVEAAEGLYLPPPDKIVHVTLFAGFSALWVAAAWPERRTWAILVAGLALAALTELGQDLPFVARDGNLADGLADSSGILVGLVVATWWLSRGAADGPS